MGTGDLELGDARRTRRLIKLVEDLSARPTGSIPVASGGWAETKAAYRLLDNPALEWREMLEVHTARTVERLKGEETPRHSWRRRLEPSVTISRTTSPAARAHGLVVVAHNTREFARVPNLVLEDGLL